MSLEINASHMTETFDDNNDTQIGNEEDIFAKVHEILEKGNAENNIAYLASNENFKIDQKIGRSQSDDEIQITAHEIPSEKLPLLDFLHMFPLKEQKERILSNEHMLNEICMDKMIHLLKKNKNFEVLSAQYMMFRDNIHAFDNNKKNEDIQIIGGVPGNFKHWRGLHCKGEQLRILDSSFRPNYGRLLSQERDYIDRRYPHI